VLGGKIRIGEKEPASIIRLSELESQIKSRKENDELDEVIIATGADPEGDYTGNTIKSFIQSIDETIPVTFLGRGLSSGSSIEYIDRDTFKNAFENRS
jgi:recombinational DNA repair protein RecR